MSRPFGFIKGGIDSIQICSIISNRGQINGSLTTGEHFPESATRDVL